MYISVIVLIYNEEGNIGPQTEATLESFDKHGLDGEVILMDDGSEDKSPELCDRLAEQHSRVVALHHRPNKGRSFGIQTGFLAAKGDIVFIMDGDQQYEPDEIPNFIAKMEEGWDVVSGLRTDRADMGHRGFISRTYNWILIKRKFKLDVKDQNSGFKAFRKEVVKNFGFEPEGYLGLHRYILPLAKIKGYRITEIPIKHYPRISGKSYIKSYTVPFIALRDYFRFVKHFKKEILESNRKVPGTGK